MLIFVDEKIPPKACEKLAEYGEVIKFKTNEIVYEAISGHPDIFFSQMENQLVVAPNLPPFYFQKLKEHQ